MGFFKFDFVRPDAQCLTADGIRIHAKRFVEDGGAAFSYAQKRTEPEERGVLIRFGSGIELQRRAVFISNAETGDALAAVGVEHPHRFAERAGDPGKEARKRAGLVVAFDDERVVFEIKNRRHWALLYKMIPMASRSLRYYLQAGVGVILFALFLQWGWIQHREPFHTYFYLFAWGSFLWVIGRALAVRTGTSPLARPVSFLGLMFLSTTFWLVFEVCNFRLHNWIYIGVPSERWLRWPGYALSFATVMPG